MAILKKPKTHTHPRLQLVKTLYLRIIFSDRLTFNKPLAPADVLAQGGGGVVGCSNPAADPGAAREPLRRWAKRLGGCCLRRIAPAAIAHPGSQSLLLGMEVGYPFL